MHERTLAALPGRVTAMAPHTYVVHEKAPAGQDVTDPAAWAASPVREESTGRREGRDEA